MMAGKTLMSFLRAGFIKMLVAGETISIFLLTGRCQPSSWSWPEPSSSSPPPPHTFRFRIISAMLDLAKTLPVLRLTTHKLIVSVDGVVGVELLATTLAGKDIATVLPNFVLARHLKRHKSFFTDITGVNPLSLCCALSPYTDPLVCLRFNWMSV